jgi:hypothetical protein
MSASRISRLRFLFLEALVFGVSLGVVAAGQALAAEIDMQSAPEISKDLDLVPVAADARERLLRAISANGGLQSMSPSHHECPGDIPHVQNLPCGSSISQQLTTTDCPAPTSGGTFYGDFYSFSGTAGQTVTINVSSSVFDTYLVLFNPNIDLAAEDNDSGEGLNSRVVITLNISGTWYVVATSAFPASFGAYTVSLQCGGGGGGGACTPNATTLCLNNSRYRVTVTFSTPAGQSGNGMAVSETSDTGMFWFFSANNIEIIIKVVTGCSFNSRVWVFAGGLTNVAYTITVTDTVTGVSKAYSNPQGTPSQPVQDTDAFVCS